jgi:Fe-S cluster biogenesis protein NfuA
VSDIKITAEPSGHSRCTFTVDRPVFNGLRRFGSPLDAQGSPLAEAIFSIEGVTELVVTGPKVTVVKSTTVPWQVAGPMVGAAIRAALESGVPPVEARGGSGATDDDTLYEKVAQIFATRINPMVAGHGGRVDLIDVQDAVVMLRLAGGCQGCGMADVTLRQGIETTLRQMAPEVQGIMDVTDHGSGANPYFAAAKK